MSPSRPYQLTDGAIRQINEGHVLTSQTLFQLQYDIVAFVRGAEISDPREQPRSSPSLCSAGARKVREKWQGQTVKRSARSTREDQDAVKGAAECTVRPPPPRADVG